MVENIANPKELLSDWLTNEHSLNLSKRISQLAAANDDLLTALMQILFSDDYRLCQRAAWSVSHLAKNQPKVLEKWLPELVAQLKKPNPDAVHRNIVRAMAELEIPENLQGEVADACFKFIADPQTAVAIRAFSMTVLEKIVRHSPELSDELALILQDGLQVEEKAAYRKRAQQTLKKLKIKNLE